MDNQMRIRLGTAVKSLGGGRIGGYLAVWGVPEEADLDGEYFTSETNFELDQKPTLPVLFHHGLDSALKAHPIGTITQHRIDDVGLWVEGILNERNEYIRAIEEMIERGLLGWSSGSMPHQVRVAKTGQIEYWPIYEGSVTHMPADWRGGTRAVALKYSTLLDFLKSAANKRRKSMNTIDIIRQALSSFAQAMGISLTDEELLQYAQSIEAAMSDNGDLEKIEAALEEDEPSPAEEAEPDSETEDLIEVIEEIRDLVSKHAKRVLSPRLKAARLSQALQSVPRAVPDEARKARFNINRGMASTPMIDLVRGLASGKGMKAQSVQQGALGGYLAGQEISQKIIEYLHANQVVMALGADVLNIANLQQYTLIRNTQSASAYFVGENTQIPASDLLFKPIVIQPKKLAARVLIPNEMLRTTSIDVEAYITRSIQEALRERMDKACLTGDGGVSGGGTGVSPVGLRHIADVTKTTLGSGNGAVPALEDLIDMERRVAEANVPMTRPGYAFSPRTKYYLWGLKDGEQQPILRDAWGDRPRAELLGHPYFDTTNIPNNETVGTSNDCSSIYFGSWNECAVAINTELEIMVNPYEFQSYDQTSVTGLMMFDFVVYRPEAFQVLLGVRAS